MVDVNLIITLNVNSLNTPLKGQIKKKKDWSVVVYKELTLNIKTHIDYMYRDGEQYTMLTLIKRKLE